MAKGDIISATLASDAAYQPASGVEIMLTTLTNTPADAAAKWRLYDGAGKGTVASPQPSSGSSAVESLVKCGITNTLYIQCVNGGSGSGVQVK